MSLSELVPQYIKNNKIKLINLQSEINNSISARICHHKVKFLYVLREIFKNDIKTYVEIGVHNGCSMSYALSSSYPIRCWGVDLFTNSTYPDKLTEENTLRFLKKVNKHNHPIVLFTGNSKKTSIIGRFNDESVDLLFIDGDHSYNGVKADFNNYFSKVRKGGFIVFDDYNKAVSNRGVYRFINELKRNSDKLFSDSFEYYDFNHKKSKFKDGIIAFIKA